MSFSLKTLELDKILEVISKNAKTNTASNFIMSLSPDNSLDIIRKELNKTNNLFSIIKKFKNLPLIEDFDIFHITKNLNIVDMSLDISMLYELKVFFNMEIGIIKYFRNVTSEKTNIDVIAYLIEDIFNHKVLKEKIDNILGDDGRLFDDASIDLKAIRSLIIKKEKTIIEKTNQIMHANKNYLNEELIVIRNNRYCLPFKESEKNRIKGIIHDTSASKQTVYIEPSSVIQEAIEFDNLKNDEQNEIFKILKNITLEIKTFLKSILNNIDIFIELDVLSAKALYGISLDAVIPKLNDTGIINVIDARHPLIKKEDVIPISFNISDSYPILLITGPNTGGKTAALKTLGLLTLMIQVGILIPVNENSELSIFETVFADIGDDQSISQSLSTFSSHLTKIKFFLDNLKNRNLILLDELGSGTDPEEGVALAISIINEFRKSNVRMLITTHYSELKTYALENSDILTASVAFDSESLKPLYYLEMGKTGSSNAIKIAKRLGINDSIIDNAKNYILEHQTNLSKILSKLNLEYELVKKEKKELQNLEKELIKRNDEYEILIKKVESEKDKTIKDIREKEEQKWQKVIDEAKKTLEELSSKENLSMPESAKYKHELNSKLIDDNSSNEEVDFLVNELVYVISYQQFGVIKKIKGNKYSIEIGNFIIDFKKNEIKKTDRKKKEVIQPKKAKKTTSGVTPSKDAKLELDLRGVRYEEVALLVDKAIDQAILSGLMTLRIIHGFGTGAVKNALYEYLKKSPYVLDKRYGGENEGLNGVTIVTLK